MRRAFIICPNCDGRNARASRRLSLSDRLWRFFSVVPSAESTVTIDPGRITDTMNAFNNRVDFSRQLVEAWISGYTLRHIAAIRKPSKKFSPTFLPKRNIRGKGKLEFIYRKACYWASQKRRNTWRESRIVGGEGGIRTPGTVPRTLDFESSAFNRARPPLRGNSVS